VETRLEEVNTGRRKKIEDTEYMLACGRNHTACTEGVRNDKKWIGDRRIYGRRWEESGAYEDNREGEKRGRER